MTVLFLYNSTHGLQVPQQSPFQRWALDAFVHALRHPRTPAAHFFRHNATSSAFLLFNRSPYFVQCHWKLSRCSSLVALPHQLPQFTFVSFSQRMPYLYYPLLYTHKQNLCCQYFPSCNICNFWSIAKSHCLMQSRTKGLTIHPPLTHV